MKAHDDFYYFKFKVLALKIDLENLISHLKSHKNALKPSRFSMCSQLYIWALGVHL